MKLKNIILSEKTNKHKDHVVYNTIYVKGLQKANL